MEAQWRIFIDVLIAAGLTAFVGYERERLEKPAGIRTNMIIGSFSCLIVSITPNLVRYLQQNTSQEIITADPIRILQALIIGVSFVGAGTIIKSVNKNKIHGITTAATLLYSSSIGITTALGQYVLAILVTLLILIINWIINRIIRRFADTHDHHSRQ